MNINRIHTVVGTNSITNVDLSQISSVTFLEWETRNGFFGMSFKKYYGLNVILKTQSEFRILLKDHKSGQQEYASLFTAWTEYLEWYPISKH